MGIFATRPEEPFEWTGLPAEPARPESDIDQLGMPAVDTTTLGATVESIVIPVATTTEVPQSPRSGEPDAGQ